MTEHARKKERRTLLEGRSQELILDEENRLSEIACEDEIEQVQTG